MPDEKLSIRYTDIMKRAVKQIDIKKFIKKVLVNKCVGATYKD